MHFAEIVFWNVSHSIIYSRAGLRQLDHLSLSEWYFSSD